MQTCIYANARQIRVINLFYSKHFKRVIFVGTTLQHISSNNSIKLEHERKSTTVHD